MADAKSVPRPLPPWVVGGKRNVYAALCVMADEGPSSNDPPHREVYFRKTTLATQAGLSISRITPILHWLQSEGYLSYTPGNPGSLSRVAFMPAERANG